MYTPVCASRIKVAPDATSADIAFNHHLKVSSHRATTLEIYLERNYHSEHEAERRYASRCEYACMTINTRVGRAAGGGAG